MGPLFRAPRVFVDVWEVSRHCPPPLPWRTETDGAPQERMVLRGGGTVNLPTYIYTYKYIYIYVYYLLVSVRRVLRSHR